MIAAPIPAPARPDDTFAWVDAVQSFAEHRARLEHVVRDEPITPAQYRRLTGW